MTNLVKLHTDSQININRIAALLLENEIPSMIKDGGAAGRTAGFGTVDNSVDLFIEKGDLEAAEKILNEMS